MNNHECQFFQVETSERKQMPQKEKQERFIDLLKQEEFDRLNRELYKLINGVSIQELSLFLEQLICSAESLTQHCPINSNTQNIGPIAEKKLTRITNKGRENLTEQLKLFLENLVNSAANLQTQINDEIDRC